jgi:hypothetical protein
MRGSEKTYQKVAVIEIDGVIVVGRPEAVMAGITLHRLCGIGNDMVAEGELHGLYDSSNLMVEALNHMLRSDPRQKPMIDYVLQHGLARTSRMALATLFPDMHNGSWSYGVAHHALNGSEPSIYADVLRVWAIDGIEGTGNAIASAVDLLAGSLAASPTAENAGNVGRVLEAMLNPAPDLSSEPWDSDNAYRLDGILSDVLTSGVAAQKKLRKAEARGRRIKKGTKMRVNISYEALTYRPECKNDAETESKIVGANVYFGLLDVARRNLQKGTPQGIRTGRKALACASKQHGIINGIGKGCS